MNTTAHQCRQIAPSEISVVVQGPTFYKKDDESCQFRNCIASIRRSLPGAEIIVSTWRGQPCDESIVDRVIFNEELPPIHDPTGISWNFNRMVVSTRNGIVAATRPYLLKFRADLVMTGPELARITVRELPSGARQYKIFEEPVTLSNIYVRNPSSYAPLLFHASDIVQFGRTSDLLDLWDRALVSENNIRTNMRFTSPFVFLGYLGLRMVPEQALTIGWLNSKGYDIRIPYPSYLSREYFRLSEMILSTNFFLVDWQYSGIEFPKRFFRDKSLPRTIYSSSLFNDLSYKYEDPSFANRRFRRMMWQTWAMRPLLARFWIDLIATPLLRLSPKLFIWARGLRRNFLSGSK